MIRDYQLADIERIRTALRTHNRIVYQLPTGAGKTVVAAEISRLLNQRGKSLLLLVHRRELIEQAFQTIMSACPGIKPGIIAAGYAPTPWSRLQIASIQTLHRRDYIKLAPDLIIIDEAHHTGARTWFSVIERWPKTKLIGLTATPTRMDGKPLPEIFEALVPGLQVRDLIEQGYLAPVRVIAPSESHLTNKMLGDIKITGGDYNAGAVYKKVSNKVVADATHAYQRYADGKQAIFFGVTIEHSKRVADAMIEAGIDAVHLDGDTDAAWRSEAMDRFRRREFKVICNVNLISEGVDAPACEVILMGRPTQSVVVYLQQCGRAMRPQPGKQALIIDLVRNCFQGDLGLPDDERNWELRPGEAVRQNKVIRPRRLRRCEACGEVYKIDLEACPQCKATPDAGIEVTEVVVDMLEVSKAQIVAEQKPARRFSHKEAVRRAYQARGDIDTLKWIAAANNYKPGWADMMRKVTAPKVKPQP